MMHGPIRVGGHPVHPMLVHFPIALWTLGVASDVGGWTWGHPLWWLMSFGLQALGVLVALLAMGVGFFDYLVIPRHHSAQRTAVLHMTAMSAAWLLFTVSVTARGLPQGAAPSFWATLAGALGLAVMIVGAGWGGQLVYGFGIAVAAAAEDAGSRADGAPTAR